MRLQEPQRRRTGFQPLKNWRALVHPLRQARARLPRRRRSAADATEPSAAVTTEAPPADALPTEQVESGSTISVTDPGGDFVQFPDGLKVTIVSVETPDPTIFGQQEDGEQPLVLTTRWENTGSIPVELAGYDNTRATLLAGPNGFQADSYAVGGPDTELPARVTPGTTFDYRTYYSVPDPSVLELIFNPNPEVYQDVTFTDVQALIR